MGDTAYGSRLKAGTTREFCLVPQPRPAIEPRQIAVIILRILRAHDGVAEAGVFAGGVIDVLADGAGHQLHPRGAGKTLLAVVLQRGRVIVGMAASMCDRHTASSIAWQAPCAKYCSIGCAASPSSATRPSTQRSTGSRSHKTHSRQFLPCRMISCARSCTWPKPCMTSSSD